MAVIPSFNELGYLSPGVHPVALDEIDARLGYQLWRAA